jgi:hypothetical protein
VGGTKWGTYLPWPQPTFPRVRGFRIEELICRCFGICHSKGTIIYLVSQRRFYYIFQRGESKTIHTLPIACDSVTVPDHLLDVVTRGR